MERFLYSLFERQCKILYMKTDDSTKRCTLTVFPLEILEWKQVLASLLFTSVCHGSSKTPLRRPVSPHGCEMYIELIFWKMPLYIYIWWCMLIFKYLVNPSSWLTVHFTWVSCFIYHHRLSLIRAVNMYWYIQWTHDFPLEILKLIFCKR